MSALLDASPAQLAPLLAGALGTALLARRAGLGRAASVLAGVAFAVGAGTGEARRDAASALVPWALLLRASDARRGRLGAEGTALLGLAAAAALADASGGVFLLLAAAVAGRVEEARAPARARGVALAAVGCAVGLGLREVLGVAGEQARSAARPADLVALGACVLVGGVFLWRARAGPAAGSAAWSGALGVVLSALFLALLLARRGLPEASAFLLVELEPGGFPRPALAVLALALVGFASGRAPARELALGLLALVLLGVAAGGPGVRELVLGTQVLGRLDPLSAAGAWSVGLALVAAGALERGELPERASVAGALALAFALSLAAARPEPPDASPVDPPDELFACTLAPPPVVGEGAELVLAGWVRAEVPVVHVSVLARRETASGIERRHVALRHGPELAPPGAPRGALGFEARAPARELGPGTWAFRVELRGAGAEGEDARLGVRTACVTRVAPPSAGARTWLAWGAVLALLCFPRRRAAWGWPVAAVLSAP